MSTVTEIIKQLVYVDRNYDGLHIKFRQVGHEKLRWRFDVNFMQANPFKFHCIVVPKKLGKTFWCLNTCVILQPRECVKLLEMNVDSRLNCNQDISYLSKKNADRCVNALSRMSECLDYRAKFLFA